MVIQSQSCGDNIENRVYVFRLLQARWISEMGTSTKKGNSDCPVKMAFMQRSSQSLIEFVNRHYAIRQTLVHFVAGIEPFRANFRQR